jgi:hypothetical protein
MVNLYYQSLHNQAQELSIKARELQKERGLRDSDAKHFYLNAAKLEEIALKKVPSEFHKTRTLFLLSAVSLYHQAFEDGLGRKLAEEYMGTDKINGWFNKKLLNKIKKDFFIYRLMNRFGKYIK